MDGGATVLLCQLFGLVELLHDRQADLLVIGTTPDGHSVYYIWKALRSRIALALLAAIRRTCPVNQLKLLFPAVLS
jgi:hypothetical protein